MLLVTPLHFVPLAVTDYSEKLHFPDGASPRGDGLYTTLRLWDVVQVNHLILGSGGILTEFAPVLRPIAQLDIEEVGEGDVIVECECNGQVQDVSSFIVDLPTSTE